MDGQIGYGPFSAERLYPGSIDAPGLPGLTFEATRDPATGDTTIHEQDPIVVCPTDTYPPTATSCPRFDPAGVQLDRTITTTDGGRQILISDTWRSTDGHAHTVAAQYTQQIAAADNTPPASSTPVGLNLPWLGGGYRTFTTDTTFPGPTTTPATTPASVFVRDHNTVADGDRRFPRGAISLDPAPHTVRWADNKRVVLNYDAITVPAGGGTQVRQAFVIGTTEAEIAAKAAAQRDQINPYRPDALIRRHHTSRFAGDQVYNTSGTQQTAKGHIRRHHRTVTFDVQVQNDGTTTDTLLLQGHRPGRGFTVHYYAGTHGHTNITTAVRRGSYQLPQPDPRPGRDPADRGQDQTTHPPPRDHNGAADRPLGSRPHPQRHHQGQGPGGPVTWRRTAIFALALAGAGLPAVALSSPAQAAITTSHISAPVDGSRYLVTDDQPVTSVIVTGTSSGAAGDLLDLRCYFNSVRWTTVQHNVPVAADGSFATLMPTDGPFGTCILRAVPAGLPGGSNLSLFTGPRVTGEKVQSIRVDGTGPNAGKVYEYLVWFQGVHGLNANFSATGGGVVDSRLLYDDGTSSDYLWGRIGSLANPQAEAERAPVRVDGQIGYGPSSAAHLYIGSLDARGCRG